MGSNRGMDLTQAELQELDELLHATPEPLQALDVVSLDGYLCAVLVQPRLIAEDDWLLPILDTEGRARPDGVQPHPGWRARIATLARRRHAALNEAIAEDGWFEPLIPPPEEELEPESEPEAEAEATATATATASTPSGPPASPPELDAPRIRDTLAPWSAGFEYGLNCFPDLLDGPVGAEGASAAEDDPAVGEAIARVLRYLEPQDEAEAQLQAVLDREQPLTTLDDAIDDLVAAVADLWELNREARYKVEVRRRDAPKVGRNDACPCGSGRKYKRCHGADASA